MNGSLRTANLSIIGKCSFSGNADRNGEFEYPTLINPHLSLGRGVNHIEVMERKFCAVTNSNLPDKKICIYACTSVCMYAVLHQVLIPL